MSIVSKPPPKGWPRMSASVFYEQAAPAIEFLCAAFGFEVRLNVPGANGKVAHAELALGDGVVMTGDDRRDQRPLYKSPQEVGGANTCVPMFYIDDVDAHCARARAAGATISVEPRTQDHGPDYWADRSYEAVDPEGHRWYFVQRLRG